MGEVYISDDPLDAKIIEGFRLNHLNMRDAGTGKVVLRQRPRRCGERACSWNLGSVPCVAHGSVACALQVGSDAAIPPLATSHRALISALRR